MKKDINTKKEQEEIEKLTPYKHDKIANIPSWVKITILKFWAAGAAFFFVGTGAIGLGHFQFFMLLSLVLALFNDYIVRQIVRMMKNSKDNTYRLNLVNHTGVKGLLLNLLYALLIVELMIILGALIIDHGLWFNLFGSDDLRADPFLAGFIFVILDAIAVLIKNFIYDLKTKNK